MTTAEAIVRYMTAQRIVVDDVELPLFAGVFAIFGHGNVTALGVALEAARDRLPTWRGQNEQTMAMAAIAFAKAKRRRQIMVATSSIGPGAANMVTAAGIGHANRLPVLLLAGDTFASRIPDPVLQQVEHFDDPTVTVNDAFKAVVRYWDRITRPEQILESLPQAIAVMLDPEDCGPAFVGLPQDVQAEAFDYPARFFEPRTWQIRRPGSDPREVDRAAAVLSQARAPLIVAGGGVHYAAAEHDLRDFAARRRIPVVETVAGKGTVVWDDPVYAGPLGVTGSTAANALAADADVVLAVGTRLQDFTTGSWTVFQHPDLRIVSCNVGRFDSTKHRAISLVADAQRGLHDLDIALLDWAAPPAWMQRVRREMAAWNAYVDEVTAPSEAPRPSYAQVIGAVGRAADPGDYALAAAGGFPGELNKVWRVRTIGAFDCEYGFSCMGYEIGGAWGAAMARPGGDVIAFVGDGSYLMANSDVFSAAFTGFKVIWILADNGGFAVINRLQEFKGGAPFNNLLEHSRGNPEIRVDFVAHARALGARAERVETTAELEDAVCRAKAAEGPSVIVIETDPYTWTGGDAWWETGVPEVSEREAVRVARAEHEAEKKRQRIGT